MSEPLHLLDVNVLIARIFEDHEHHRAAVALFDTAGLQWALCPWTEAGFLRYATRSGRLSMGEATGLLHHLAQRQGYHFHPVAHNWRTLTEPFFGRLHGHRQVTDACLLGLALKDRMVLVTFDKGILHLAGGQDQYVRVV